MTSYETRRQEQAAWLMYHLGLSRRHADAITRVVTHSNRRTLVREIGAFRIHGLPDPETVAWYEAGVCLASLAASWRDGGYQPHEFVALRDMCLDRNVDDPSEMLNRILEDGITFEFALLCLRAGARTENELTDWFRQERAGDDIRSRLIMLAGLST